MSGMGCVLVLALLFVSHQGWHVLLFLCDLVPVIACIQICQMLALEANT